MSAVPSNRAMQYLHIGYTLCCNGEPRRVYVIIEITVPLLKINNVR